MLRHRIQNAFRRPDRSLGRAFSGLVATAVVLSSTLSALAAGPLDLIPKNAGVVVRLKDPNGTIAKVGNFANQIQPGLGFMVQGQASAMGLMISNPTLAGVDLKQDWHIAVFPVVNAEPAVVFVVPTTDADALKEAVGPGFSFMSKDSWAAYSQDEAVIELIEDLADGNGESVAMDRRSQGVFDGGDVSVYVNVASLAETYKDQLDEADGQIDEFVEQLAAQIPSEQGLNLGPILGIYGDIGKGFLQAVRDSESFSAGIGVTNEAITIEELLIVEADSDTDGYLQVHKPGDLAVLNRLPQDKLGYMGLQMDMKSMIAWGLDLAAKFAEGTKDSTDENLKRVSETIEKFQAMGDSLEGIEIGASGWAFGLKDSEAGILEGYTISQANPAAKMREVTRQMSSLGQIELPGIKQEFIVEEDAEKYGDLSADIIRVKQEFSEEADPLGIQRELQKLMYGEEGAVQRVVITDGHVVQTIGGTQDDMKALLAAFEAGADTSSTLSASQKARNGLLEKANFVGLIDLPNLAVKGLGIAAKTGQLPIPVPLDGIENVKIQPSFVGFSVGTEPQGLRMKTQISAGTARGIMQIVSFFQRQMQQGQGGF